MSRKSRTNPTSSFSTAGSWIRAGIYLVLLLFILLSTLPVQADPESLPDPQEGEQPEGYWQLTGSDASDTWQGNKFHGLEAEYSPSIGENSLGATYTEYNIKFKADAPDTVARTLNGTCTWEWGEGFIPDQLKSGTSYPFNMRATANLEGQNMAATVNASTTIREGSVAFAQAYLAPDGSNMFDSKTASASLNLPVGQSDGEGRSVTLLCQIDIVTVQRVYTYQWKETSCTATLALPKDMQPNKDFTPQLSVVDKDNKTVKPDKETWYYNEAASPLPMKWDGKEAAVKYEYICPGGTKTRTVSVTIPKAASCTATLTLPEKMVPDELFTPTVSVVGGDNLPVTPASETWYYNDTIMPQTMKWDGKETVVKYDYVCPNETETKTVSVTIPPAKTCGAAIVLPDKMEADKEFTPRADVVNKAEGTPVIPQEEKWYLNGELSVLPMKWDGKSADVKYEYKCPLDSQTLTAEKSIPPAPGSDFILVVGGLAAVAAAGLAAAGAGAIALKGGTRQELPERYILQVDKDYLEVKAKFEAPLFIQVWKVKSDGSAVPVSDASIRVELPSDNAGLAASPASGTGSLTCMFSVPHPRECTDVPVTISATAGLLKKTALVTVRILPLYELELSWLDPANTRLEPGGSEVYAVATLEAAPRPDARTTADDLAERISLNVEGPNSAFVRLSTSAGPRPYVSGGKLWIPLSVPALPQDTSLETGNPILTASFTDGSQRVEAQLPLEISGECVLGAWVLGKKQADVLFEKDSENPHWIVPEIVTYFHEPLDDSTPVHPGITYTLTDECVKFDPDVLIVSEINQHDKDQYTIKCEINPSANLEDAFGKDLDQGGGIIKVIITPKTNPEGRLSAEVKYQISPQFELIVTPSGESERQYKGMTFKGFEFLADSDDSLCLGVACVRTDIQGEQEERIARSLDASRWSLSTVALGGAMAGMFKTVLPEEPVEERSLTVQSFTPQLYMVVYAEKELILHVEGELVEGAPPNYRRRTILVDIVPDIKLSPRFPQLKLWVVPGQRRGESEVWMVVYLGKDPNQRLADIILEVNTENLGAGQLLTPNGDTRASVITGADGTEQVNLWYKYMDWNNYQEAVFMVKACITNQNGERRSEEISTTIHINDNVHRMLADLQAKAGILKLNNPYYEEGLGITDLIMLTTLRPAVRGPVWNFSLLISEYIASARGDNRPMKFSQDYVCSEFRDRIAEWLISRRHYRPGGLHNMDIVQRMNGIEFDHFTIGGYHNYEALFLAGMQPEDDPRGLDPWWKQNWHDTAYLDPDGLITNNWERYYATETAAWLQISLQPLALLGIWSGGVTVAVLIELLGPALVAYSAATAGELGSRWGMGTAYEGGQYHFNRADNRYTPRNVFIDEWAADQGA